MDVYHRCYLRYPRDPTYLSLCAGHDLVDEDASFMEYLEGNGWDGVVVGEDMM